jgi:uncharacterized protein (DUF433 family)
MKSPVNDVLGRGVYGASEALRLINFRRSYERSGHSISRQTMARWLRGYNYRSRDGAVHHSDPLWQPDYINEDETIELSFRDLIELRFVKAFRDVGLSLPTIRECFMRAVEAVNDQRPFSTRRFRTDGRTIFLEITHDIREGELLDLKRRQVAFHRIVAPSLHDLEFDAEIVARWFPLGMSRKTIVVDPMRSFGRPIVSDGGIPVEVLSEAVEVEGSAEKVAKLYEVPLVAVRDANCVPAAARGLKLLVDHNLSPRLARCLQALFIDDHQIVALSDKFSTNVTDIQWITSLDDEGGWAVLTKDLRIRTRPHERAALDRSRVVYFFLAGSWRKFTVEESASRLIRLISEDGTTDTTC